QRRPLARLAIEEPLDLSRGRRASEEVALAEAAAELPQALRLRRMLDALRHGRQAERIREAQDRVDERLVRILADELVHERLRNLQRLDRELREPAQRRVARAEVVDRQPHSEVTQPPHRDERA